MSDYKLRLPTLHPAQKLLRTEASRFNVACMGRRFGKTVCGLDLLIDPILVEGWPAGWIAPTYKLLDEVWREANRTLKPLVSRKDGQQKRIELVTGGVLDFWSLEDPDAGRSRKYKRLIVDEAAMARHLQVGWEQSLSPTLMDYEGDAWFMSTPKGIVGPGKYFKELFDRGVPGSGTYDPEWKSWQMPTSMNPYIKASEIEKMRRELPELVFQQEVLAQFVDFGGTMVKREWLRRGEVPAGLTNYAGVDLAISLKQTADYTAVVVIARDRTTGRVWIVYVDRARVGFNDALEMIQRVARRFGPAEIAVEATQYQAAVVEQLLRTTDLPVRPVRPDKDKLTRFQPLQVRYQQGLVWHANDLAPWFEEELLSFPLGEHDDGVDAAAHAFALAGEFGRTQFLYSEPTMAETQREQVAALLPGVPQQVIQMLDQLPPGEICGRCEHYRAETSKCAQRDLIVQPRDPGCVFFASIPVVEVKAEPEPAVVEAGK